MNYVHKPSRRSAAGWLVPAHRTTSPGPITPISQKKSIRKEKSKEEKNNKVK